MAPYQPGALPITGQEQVEIASSASATSAATWRMPIIDLVGKAPSAMTTSLPSSNDLFAFFQRSSGLYYNATIGSIGATFGNLPTGGGTGQVLIKNSSTNYDASFSNLSTLMTAGVAIALSGSTTVTIQVATGGIGSAQIAAGAIGSTQVATGGITQAAISANAIGSAQIATNAVGNVQFRQGQPLSVVGVAGNATANVADIVGVTPGSLLQINAGGTGIVFGAFNTASLPGPYQTGTLTQYGVLYGNNASAIGVTPVGTANYVLMGQGGATSPIFSTINLATTLSITGTLNVAQGGIGTTTFTAHGILVGNATNALYNLPTSATGTLLIGQGTASDPSWVVPSGDWTIATTGVATIAANAVTNAKLATVPAQTIKGNNTFTTANVSDLTPAQAGAVVASPRYLAGFIMSTPGSSTAVTVGSGACVDTSNFTMMVTTASLTKTTATWTLGNLGGGLDTGAVSTGTTYHWYAIQRPDTGVTDFIFSLSTSAPLYPANYSASRRIGSLMIANGTAQWTKFYQDGDRFMLDTPVSDLSSASVTTARTLFTLSIPKGLQFVAYGNFNMYNGTAASAHMITDPTASDVAPNLTSMYTLVSNGLTYMSGQVQCRTNTSGQLGVRSDNATSNLDYWITVGWFDTRGK